MSLPRTSRWSIRFQNHGGPLLALPRELLDYWNGSHGESTSGVVPFGPDYTRACEAAPPACLVEVGPGFGLVIGNGEQIDSAAWLELADSDEINLVGWSFSVETSERKTADFLLRAQLSWQRLPQRVHLASGELLLFHPATAGREVQVLDPIGAGPAVTPSAVPSRTAPGSYFLEVAVVGDEIGEVVGEEYDEFSNSIFCRWVKE